VQEEIMKEIREENIAEAIYDNPDAMRLLNHIESITVENGRLVIKPKSEV
jgi:hypothetical protein